MWNIFKTAGHRAKQMKIWDSVLSRWFWVYSFFVCLFLFVCVFPSCATAKNSLFGHTEEYTTNAFCQIMLKYFGNT